MPLSALLRNLRRSGYAWVVSDKLVSRVSESTSRMRRHAPASAWVQREAKDVAALVTRLDADLWSQSQRFAAAFEQEAGRRLETVGLSLGGGGHYPLLHFLTRLCKPTVVVETGVAAGWSSVAILEALESNQHGTLHSSDFPYFRLPDPEKLIGILVEDRLRARWHLYVRGDQQNLPEIMAELDRVDLFHYDSDKSVRGRRRALDQVLPKLSPSSLVIMDDVQDNFHFRDLVAEQKWEYWIAPFAGKFTGLTGPGFGGLYVRRGASESG